MSYDLKKEEEMGIKYVHTCKGSEKCHATNHLCQVVAKRDMGEVKKLIQDPVYYCKNCGRAAHSKGNLCNPTKL